MVVATTDRKRKWIPKREFIAKRLNTKVQYLDYAPYGAIRELFRCRNAEVVLSGPANTGKSRGALEKCHWMLDKYPRIRGLMVRKTRRSITQSCMVTYEEKVLPYRGYIPFHGGDQEWRYKNGSIFAVAGIDDPNKIFSSEWDFVYVNQAEELDLSDWESILSRIS